MNALNAAVLDRFPQPDAAAVDALLEAELAKNRCKLVVLDDDPTGIQTVHDVPVYTDWSLDSIRAGFAEAGRLFFILTNSRSMTAAESAAVHTEISDRTARVSRETGVPYLLICRGDSTLRGHYPLETQVLKEGLERTGTRVDGEVLCPFFKEGGRFTIGNIHYVRQGDRLVPAAETEFARDRTFGYAHSSLPEYIEEKTGGAFRAADVRCISLDSLRRQDYDGVEAQLLEVQSFGKICVNAVDDIDLKVFSVALYRAMGKGKTFLFRTAASLIKAMAGIPDAPLLTREALIPGQSRTGGLVIVGSHTQRTTEQLNELLKLEGVVPVAFDSDQVLLGDAAFDAEVDRCVAEEERIITAGKTAVCYTRRRLLTLATDTGESALRRSVKISDGVQRLVGNLKCAPAFVVAKGGITSSDVGTKALKVRRAWALGQIKPSVPVWRTGPESRFPGMPYVIFPGNTGDRETLRAVVQVLTGGQD